MDERQSGWDYGEPEAIAEMKRRFAEVSGRRQPHNGGGNGNGDGIPEPPLLNPNLRVVAIEKTQATQFFNFNGQGSGLAPDNSIPLVANKDIVFRVYTDVQQVSTAFPVPSYITGGLWVYQINWPPPNAEYHLTPINSPITGIPAGSIYAAPASNIQRANANSTLNFRLPAWLAMGGSKGTMGISAGIWDPGHPGDPAYTSEGLTLPSFNFLPGRKLQLYGVRIRYTGPDPVTDETPLRTNR